MTAPERIWTDWKAANDACVAFDEPPANETEGYRDAYILVTAHEAAVAAARAEAQENAMQALAALGQAQEAYEAQQALAAELAATKQRLENGLKWCDLMDGPVSKSQFVNGQATAAQQIRAALRAEVQP